MTDSAPSGHSEGMQGSGVATGAIPIPGESGSDEVARDKPTFSEVYETHFAFVWRTLKRLGVPQDSLDDAAQDAFIVVHRRLGGFEGRSSLKTWLFGIVMRVAHDHRRTSERKDVGRHGTAVEGDHCAALGMDPSEGVTRAEEVRLLHRILDRLDDDKRAVFVLAELEQMTAPEIAEALSVNLNTVYSRLRAARAAFEDALQVSLSDAERRER